MRRSLPTARTTTSPELRPTRICTSDPVRAARVVRVALQRLLHPERGVARAHRVILVGERRAEQRHDPVAHHLVDGALVAVHGLHHALEHGIEDLARLLGSRSASSSIEPLRSAKSTVTCLRSPSRAAFEVRIFSARCFGVYESGAADFVAGAGRSGAAH
jgi:hypothetical protein